MPSSISSSDADLPDAPWGRLWAVAVLLIVASLAGLELTVRAYGFGPSLIDDPDLWSAQREQLEGAGPEAVALLGASRIVTNVAPDVLREELPGRTIVQLGVEGMSPVAALADLADDPGFDGLAVVCIMPEWLLDEQATQEAYVRHYRRDWGILNRTERSLRTWLQDRFALAQFRLDPLKVRTWIATGAAPVNRFRRVTPDRWSALAIPADPADLARTVDFRMKRHESLRKKTIAEDRWIADVGRLAEMAAKIRARGGEVVFLRNVTSGGVLEIDEQAFPRARYWDVLAARCGGPSIHFADVPEMARLACFEGSHLDRDAAAKFTRALAAQLRKLGVVHGPAEGASARP